MNDLTNASMRQKMMANHLQLIDQFSSIHDPLKLELP